MVRRQYLQYRSSSQARVSPFPICIKLQLHLGRHVFLSRRAIRMSRKISDSKVVRSPFRAASAKRRMETNNETPFDSIVRAHLVKYYTCERTKISRLY